MVMRFPTGSEPSGGSVSYRAGGMGRAAQSRALSCPECGSFSIRALVLPAPGKRALFRSHRSITAPGQPGRSVVRHLCAACGTRWTTGNEREREVLREARQLLRRRVAVLVAVLLVSVVLISMLAGPRLGWLI